ncbi:MAG: hypothetical protein ABIR51_07925 [Sphingomicrobium sp.]
MTCHVHFARALPLALLLFAVPAAAQDALDQRKKELEVETAEIGKYKALSELAAGPRATTEGKASVTNPEVTAEGVVLSHVVAENTARAIAGALEPGNGRRLLIAFGDRPVSTAQYLAMAKGVRILGKNFDAANAKARIYYANKGAGGFKSVPRPGTYYVMRGEMATQAIGPLSVGLAVVDTVASLFRVETTIAGTGLTISESRFRTLLSHDLQEKGWVVAGPPDLATSTKLADKWTNELEPKQRAALDYYGTYMTHLAKKDGKIADLPEGEIAVGQALGTVLGDYDAMQKALYTPVEGVLLATIVEEQAELVEGPKPHILYIAQREAGLTSMEKKGFFTGLGGSIPAFVSAASVIDYALVGGPTPIFGSVRSQTPLMRISDVSRLAINAPR